MTRDGKHFFGSDRCSRCGCHVAKADRFPMCPGETREEAEKRELEEERDDLRAKLQEAEKRAETAERECERLRAENGACAEVIDFYSDPQTYFAISLLCDPPSGDFADDFSETELGNKPGRRAREFLASLDGIEKRHRAEIEQARAEGYERGKASVRAPLPPKHERTIGCKCHWEEGDSPCPVHGESE